MSKTIEQLIAELQEIARENPGITCYVVDNEDGVGNVEIKKQRVYPEYGNLTCKDEEGYQLTAGTVKYYDTSALEYWNSFSTEDKESYKDFTEFEEQHLYNKAFYQKEKQEYEQAPEVLTLSFGYIDRNQD